MFLPPYLCNDVNNFSPCCWWDANGPEIKFVHWRTSLKHCQWKCLLPPICWFPAASTSRIMCQPCQGDRQSESRVWGGRSKPSALIVVTAVIIVDIMMSTNASLFSWDFKITTSPFPKLSRMGWIRDKMIVLLCTCSLQDFSRKCGSFTAQF